MKVSVVIPAYNAATFVEKAIRSASIQPEVSEILVVDDGSRDQTLEVCRHVATNDPKVRILQHPEQRNRGVSASRNLGIENATNELIAFLDADDYYLSNRFHQDVEILRARSSVDGVYGAISAEFITAVGEKNYRRFGMKSVTTVSAVVQPENLVYVLLGMSQRARGHFSLDALTVRKSLLLKAGLFDIDLKIGEDTDIIVRMSVLGKLVPGSIVNPVAVRGVHDQNTITNGSLGKRDKMLLWTKLAHWGGQNAMPPSAVEVCRQRALSWSVHQVGFFPGLVFLVRLRSENPELWHDPILLRRIVKGVFGSGLIGRVVLRTLRVFHRGNDNIIHSR